MRNKLFQVIDWFIPTEVGQEKSELSLARNFVFTHIAGPALGQSIVIFLFAVDPKPGAVFWIIEASISLFWALPILLKLSGNLTVPVFISVQNLTFVALFGSFYFGGMSSPFLPWLLVAILLGFFYLASRPLLVIGCLVAQSAIFFACSAWRSGLPEIVPLERLGSVALISAIAATIYMWWMSVYYAFVVTQKSAINQEAERHRETHARLRVAMNRAENASRAKSIFLAKMSHELRTPLNAVIGYSGLLLEEVSAEPSDAVLSIKADLDQIHAAGRQLLGLVDEILDLQRIEASEISISSEECDLQALLEAIAATIRPAMDANGNTFSVDLDPELGNVRTDATKLRQSVLNLLSNAAKFTSHGAVRLVARRDRKPGGDWIRLSVRDNGIGLKKSEIDRLFQNFVQAKSTTSKEYGGSGLGLALSQKFCAMLGGGITVVSEEGRGAVFTISLPADLRDIDLNASSVHAAIPGRMVA